MMARGWESKSVEEQQQVMEQAQEAPQTEAAKLAKEEIQRQKAEQARKVQALKLNEARLREQLERTTNPRYSELLNAELNHIVEQLQALQ